MPVDPKSPTRIKLLDAAEELMLSRGFVAASVDGICSAAGVTKGSFFHYFKSKVELAKEILQRFGKRQGAKFAEACGQIEDPLERVYCVIDTSIAGSKDPNAKGCLVGTVAQEIAETHPELLDACRCSFDAFADQMGGLLSEAKALHCPEAEFDPETLGPYFLSLVQGSMLLFKATGERAVMENNLRLFRGHLETLYGR